MLVVCNGNVKSGSTWLVQLVRASHMWQPIEDKWRNPNWANPSVPDEIFDEFVRAQPWLHGEYYCKQHWAGLDKFQVLAKEPGVKFLNSIRDLRDVLVSRYHHDLNVKSTSAENISDYYFSGGGRTRIREFVAYHKFWEKANTPAHLVSYERLKNDFDAEVSRMFEFLGHTLTSRDIEVLKKRSDFANMKAKSNDGFMRKGVVGDWRNHLSNEVLADLDRIRNEEAFGYQAA